jgi:diacylglycerol kinase family enzyme
MPTVIWRIFSARARMVRHRQVDGFDGCDDIVVRSVNERPIPLQVDGDYIGDVTEARFGIEPGALRVVS